jgi:hypothetical protein
VCAQEVRDPGVTLLLCGWTEGRVCGRGGMGSVVRAGGARWQGACRLGMQGMQVACRACRWHAGHAGGMQGMQVGMQGRQVACRACRWGCRWHAGGMHVACRWHAGGMHACFVKTQLSSSSTVVPAS